jgi:23S rRNA (uracil1939-C5)-methyltransferase
LSALLTRLSIRQRVPQIEIAVGEEGTALVLRALQPPSAEDETLLREFADRHDVRWYVQESGPESLRELAADGAGEQELVYRLPEFDLSLGFAPTDFVQVNAPMNRLLVARAVELLGADRQSRVLDLFCGLGNFTLALARVAGVTVGIEGDAALIARARANARRNGIENAIFERRDLATPLPPDRGFLDGGFTHVLLDPPRTGALAVLPTIAQLSPKRVLYVSCHPGTLARDLGVLVHEHGFHVNAAGVVDMFPHTTHVESVAVLEPGS